MDEPVESQMNVVFLVLDSLRKDRISPYNPAVDFTEHLETLSDSSIVFENAVTQAPWTLPSHASMFTGTYPWEHGATHSSSYFDSEHETFISTLADHGYRTAAITSNVWITPHKGMTDDFEYVENFLDVGDNRVSVYLSKLWTRFYHALGDLPKRVLGRQIDRTFRVLGVDDSCKSEETVEEVTRFIDAQSSAENFFLYVNLMEPHEPYHPPAPYKSKHGVTDESAIPQRQKDMFTMSDIDFAELRNIYDASVDYTDDLVGRIIESLDANGLREDTVLILVSDHGQALGDHDGVFGHQFTVSDPVINSVLMVDHPALEARSIENPFELRTLHDLVPYFAGIQSPPEDIFSETVFGGVEFPENFTGYIPDDRWNEFYRKYRYARRGSTTVIKSVGPDGDTSYEAIDGTTGESVQIPSDLKEAVDETGIERAQVADTDHSADRPEDEEVRKRLEQLGYR